MTSIASLRRQIERLAARVPESPASVDHMTSGELRSSICALLRISDLSVDTLRARLAEPVTAGEKEALDELLRIIEPLEIANRAADLDSSAIDMKAELLAAEEANR
jgi:hypothetical protein